MSDHLGAMRDALRRGQPYRPDIDFTAFPTWDAPMCPSCAIQLVPPPKRARRCDGCGEWFHVRRCLDGVTRFLPAHAHDELDDQIAEGSALLGAIGTATEVEAMMRQMRDEARMARQRRRVAVWFRP